MDAFRPSPELFELRSDVIATLDREGFQWLSHYSSVDCLHDVYGIEVCGIRAEEDAVAIRKVLMTMFPGWAAGQIYYKDYGREPGWKAEIHRDRPPKREQWQDA